MGPPRNRAPSMMRLLRGRLMAGPMAPSAAAPSRTLRGTPPTRGGMSILVARIRSKDAAAKAAPRLIAWASEVPEPARTSQEYVQTIQVADELAGILSPDQANSLRRELKTLRVPVFVVHTVREQMRFDTTRLVI